ncbi:isochorismate synthase [Vibrio sp. DNB22_10_4]
MRRELIESSEFNCEVIPKYHDESPFLFSSPNTSMLALGIKKEINTFIPFKKLSDEATRLIESAKVDSNDNPVLFAAVPFDESTTTRMVIPEKLLLSSRHKADITSSNMANKACTLCSSSEEYYRSGVKKILERIESTNLTKAVLSRFVKLKSQHKIERARLLQNLMYSNPEAYIFSAQLEDRVKLIGASPELLLSKKSANIVSNPLAGSRPRSNNPIVNKSSTLTLLRNAKDLLEHSIVVKEVENVLRKYCTNLNVPQIPSVVETANMLHLSTKLEGVVDQSHINSLQIAAELHPTPAVCGFPYLAAYKLIKELEGHERGYYTGMVGWCDARGNGQWVVTIRCAEISDTELCLYAGAGIVSGSNPDCELVETTSKMSTILSAVNIMLTESYT